MQLSKRIYKVNGLVNVDVLVNGVAIRTYTDERTLLYTPFNVKMVTVSAVDKANKDIDDLNKKFNNIVYL